MRRLFLSVFMILWLFVGFAQKSQEWMSYINKDLVSSGLSSRDNFFIVEAKANEIMTSPNDYEIVRSFDENHHVVRGRLGNDFDKVWSVDSKWKLDLDKNATHSLVYVVTTDDLNEKVLEGFKVIKKYPDLNTILVSGSMKKINQVLLNNPEITHISNRIYQPSVESRVIDMNLNPNRINKIHHNNPLLTGSTETISIQENKFNVNDIDLLNRSIESGLESDLMDNHATEMATVIAGAGNSFITGRGVAKEVAIVSSGFSDAMPDANQDYLDFGINTQNHSYGIPRVSQYGVEARAFDQSAFDNRNLLHVFSSGNEGLEVSSDGVYSGVGGFANLTGNIKMSKNSLVVGSADTVGNVPAFISRGPTYDGRVKPEVVAYSMVGSSNSAALVSGVAVLLQQRYREIESSDMPSALTKALLINGATDVGPLGLDFLAGYGNVNAWRSLQALTNNQYDKGVVSSGEVESFTLNIPANAVNLKVTLCWTDPPANVNDFPALVNNLDLRLVDESDVETLPWVLNENADDLDKPATRGVDELNNVEQVTLESPQTNYTIEVEGSAVTGTQEFFIVWQYDLEDSFEWDFPTGSDNMPYNGETGSYFRWTTTKTGVGELSYSIDDMNWITLDSNVDLEEGFLRWNNPPIIGDAVRARMQIDTDFVETELFTVSEPLSARVGFNCGDSLLLKWQPSPNAIDYTIYNLGEEVLEEYASTSDTFLIISDKSSISDTRFSIQPNLPAGKSLLATPTFDYTLQGVECYVFSFFQTIALDTGIYLNLSLGTTYGIDRIVFERNNVSSYEQIGEIEDVVNDELTFLDEVPNQGYNEHRAIIYFINGVELTLSAGTSFYLTEVPLRIFPNPIQAGEPLNIITKEFENRTQQLELLDYNGVIVHSQPIRGTQDFIPTDDLASGIYFYRVTADGQTYTGRILIR